MPTPYYQQLVQLVQPGGELEQLQYDVANASTALAQRETNQRMFNLNANLIYHCIALTEEPRPARGPAAGSAGGPPTRPAPRSGSRRARALPLPLPSLDLHAPALRPLDVRGDAGHQRDSHPPTSPR